eukprot:c46472_g1_i1 orf=1-222(+)
MLALAPITSTQSPPSSSSLSPFAFSSAPPSRYLSYLPSPKYSKVLSHELLCVSTYCLLNCTQSRPKIIGECYY